MRTEPGRRTLPHPNEKPIWQKGFFDRQLRHGESYQNKWLYLWENPIKNGLVKRAGGWPFQGELNVLAWHEPTQAACRAAIAGDDDKQE